MIREQQFNEENWKQELKEHIWHCYICDQCKLIRWHALSYCHNCGTKLRRMVGKTQDLQKELYELGYSESGI